MKVSKASVHRIDEGFGGMYSRRLMVCRSLDITRLVSRFIDKEMHRCGDDNEALKELTASFQVILRIRFVRLLPRCFNVTDSFPRKETSTPDFQSRVQCCITGFCFFRTPIPGLITLTLGHGERTLGRTRVGLRTTVSTGPRNNTLSKVAG